MPLTVCDLGRVARSPIQNSFNVALSFTESRDRLLIDLNPPHSSIIIFWHWASRSSWSRWLQNDRWLLSVSSLAERQFNCVWHNKKIPHLGNGSHYLIVVKFNTLPVFVGIAVHLSEVDHTFRGEFQQPISRMNILTRLTPMKKTYNFDYTKLTINPQWWFMVTKTRSDIFFQALLVFIHVSWVKCVLRFHGPFQEVR